MMEQPDDGLETPVAVLETPAEFRSQLHHILTAYLDVQQALAGDDDARARADAKQARATVGAVDGELLSGAAHHAWLADAEVLAQKFVDLASGDGIAARRKALLPATAEIWRVLQRYGYDPDAPIRRFHCPMANDGAGADWLQVQTTTANPYYGASMLLCGSQVDSLAAIAAGEGR
jgi:Cu(I)/Ag(I) efflux system membrane fusion protein